MTVLRLKKRTTFLWDSWRLKYKTRKERKVPTICEYGDQMVFFMVGSNGGGGDKSCQQESASLFRSMVAHLQLEIVDTFVDSFAKDL